ncbi:uncharacterized protein LOC144746297 isoform X1 [Ciona intestinalis]
MPCKCWPFKKHHDVSDPGGHGHNGEGPQTYRFTSRSDAQPTYVNTEGDNARKDEIIMELTTKNESLKRIANQATLDMQLVKDRTKNVETEVIQLRRTNEVTSGIERTVVTSPPFLISAQSLLISYFFTCVCYHMESFKSQCLSVTAQINILFHHGCNHTHCTSTVQICHLQLGLCNSSTKVTLL